MFNLQTVENNQIQESKTGRRIQELQRIIKDKNEKQLEEYKIYVIWQCAYVQGSEVLFY